MANGLRGQKQRAEFIYLWIEATWLPGLFSWQPKAKASGTEVAGAKTPILPLTKFLSILRALQGNSAENLTSPRREEVGGGVLPTLTVASGHTHISGDDWIRRR